LHLPGSVNPPFVLPALIRPWSLLDTAFLSGTCNVHPLMKPGHKKGSHQPPFFTG
jgi:hypothetical protein